MLLESGAEAAAASLRQRQVDAWAPGSQLLHRTLDLPGRFPHAERWADRLLSLPLHEGVSDGDAERVARAVTHVLGREVVC